MQSESLPPDAAEMNTLVQIGAGNIGRGYLAQLFFESGYRVVLADVVPQLVDRLREAGGYNLRVLDAYRGDAQTFRIEPIEAVAVGSSQFDTAIARATAVGTAVGVANLAALALPLARALAARMATGRKLNVFLCENALDAAQHLREAVLDQLDAVTADWVATNIGFVGTSVARMVPVVDPAERDRDPLLVVADAYRRLPYDATAIVDRIPPDVPEFSPRPDFAAEVRRKLFLFNMCHASLAFLGAQSGYRYVHQSLQDREHRARFIGAAQEVSAALEAEYPDALAPADNAAMVQDMLVRCGNPLLRDTVARVARDPLRKLAYADRLIGPARLCARHGVAAPNLLRVIAAAFAYRDRSDPGAQRLAELTASLDRRELVRTVTGLEPDSALFTQVLDALAR